MFEREEESPERSSEESRGRPSPLAQVLDGYLDILLFSQKESGERKPRSVGAMENQERPVTYNSIHFRSLA